MQSSLLWSRALSCLGEGAALQGTARKASIIECTLPLCLPSPRSSPFPPLSSSAINGNNLSSEATIAYEFFVSL